MKRALFLATLLLSACASPRLAAPPPAPASSYTGRYLGDAADNLGRADVELVLVQSDDTLTGEVLLTFRVGLARYTVAGEVTGSADGDTLELTLTPADPDYCPYRARLTRMGVKLAGTYLGVGCTETIKGTLELKKEVAETQALEHP